MMTGRDAVLAAFDRLFDKAAAKLAIPCDAEDKQEARRTFADRFSAALDVVAQVPMTGIPDDLLKAMEEAIESLSPAQVVGSLATIPLARQAQEMLRVVAYQAAQQRVLEHLISQTEDRYGGN
jgi:hypothetical protein